MSGVPMRSMSISEVPMPPIVCGGVPTQGMETAEYRCVLLQHMQHEVKKENSFWEARPSPIASTIKTTKDEAPPVILYLHQPHNRDAIKRTGTFEAEGFFYCEERALSMCV
jgi:hypothetical protein